MADFVSPAEFARQIGVSKQAISKAIKVGRVPVYDATGARVPSDYAGRKLVKAAEAAEQFKVSRARIDDAALGELAAEVERELAFDAPSAPTPPGVPAIDDADVRSPSLVSAKTDREKLQAELLRMRLAKERGELVSRQAYLDAFETAGRNVARSWQILPTLAEEIAGVLSGGGVLALAAWLRGKANDQCDALADLFSAPVEDETDDDADSADG